MSPAQEVRCGCRKRAITGLRCQRCETPICPDCSKPGAVGFLCRSCAAGSKSPLYDVTPARLLAAAVTGIVSGVAGGWLLATLPLGGLLMLVGTYFLGSISGEMVLRAVSRKRGVRLEIIAGFTVGLGVLAGGILHSSMLIGMEDAGVSLMTNGLPIVGAAIAGYGAFSRVRFL